MTKPTTIEEVDNKLNRLINVVSKLTHLNNVEDIVKALEGEEPQKDSTKKLIN